MPVAVATVVPPAPFAIGVLGKERFWPTVVLVVGVTMVPSNCFQPKAPTARPVVVASSVIVDVVLSF